MGKVWILQRSGSENDVFVDKTSQLVKKVVFIPFSKMWKGLGNEGIPKWNPQWEFTSHEVKQKFQGFLAIGTSALLFCLLVKALNEMRL